MASDCVDEDELYPYNPRERVRKDVSGAVVLTVGRRKVKHKGASRSERRLVLGKKRRS